MECIECGSELSEFDIPGIEGYEGLCACCSCKKMSDEFDAQSEKELKTYYKRTGKLYTFNEFYYACQDLEVNKIDLKRLPMLRGVYKDVACAHKNQESRRQLEFDFVGGDLPF